MSNIFQFIQKNGAGVGTLTLYTAVSIYLLVVEPASGLFGTFAMIFAVGPAIVVYEITEEFTDWIIKQTLEHHVAIARVRLEMQNGGEFEDWYSGENERRIDDLDQNAKQELTTALCAILIGVTAPFVGWFSFQYTGILAGGVLLVACLLVVVYSIMSVSKTINRAPKVVKS